MNQGKIIVFCLEHYCFSPFWKILYHIFFTGYISAAYTTVWCPSVVVPLGSVFKNKYLTGMSSSEVLLKYFILKHFVYFI